MSENTNNNKYEQALKIWLMNNSYDLKLRRSWSENKNLTDEEFIALIGERIEFTSGSEYDYNDDSYEESPAGLEFTFKNEFLIHPMDMVPAGKFLTEVSELIAEGN